MSKRTTAILTILIILAIVAGIVVAVRNLVSNNPIVGGLGEGQVSAVTEHLINGRNELLVEAPADDENGNGEDTEEEGEEPEPEADSTLDKMLAGETSGGIRLSGGAIANEQSTYRELTRQRKKLARDERLYTSVDTSVEVDTLTVNDDTALAVVEETTVFVRDHGDDSVERKQTVERILTFNRADDDEWTLSSMRTMSGKDAPENGI